MNVVKERDNSPGEEIGRKYERMKRRAWYAAHREEQLARVRAYREANPEKVAEQQKKSREKNRDRIRERSRAYYALNREEIRAQRKRKKCDQQTEANGGSGIEHPIGAREPEQMLNKIEGSL